MYKIQLKMDRKEPRTTTDLLTQNQDFGSGFTGGRHFETGRPLTQAVFGFRMFIRNFDIDGLLKKMFPHCMN